MSKFVERRFQPIGSTFLATQEDCAGRPLKRSNSFSHISIEHARLLEPPAPPSSKTKAAGRVAGAAARKPKRLSQQVHKAGYPSAEGLHQASGITLASNTNYDHARYLSSGSSEVDQASGITEVSRSHDHGGYSCSGPPNMDKVASFPELNKTSQIHPDSSANSYMNSCQAVGFPETHKAFRIYHDSASTGYRNTYQACVIPQTGNTLRAQKKTTSTDLPIIDKSSSMGDKFQKNRSHSDDPTIQVNGNEITWCVMNIPRSMTTRELAQMVFRDGLAESLDFVYVPQGSNAFNRQRGNQRRFENLGYGFVNFADRSAAFELLMLWHQQPVFLPYVQVNVSLAKAQGRTMNERMFSFGKAGRIRNPMLRPLVYRLDNRAITPQQKKNDENAFISL